MFYPTNIYDTKLNNDIGYMNYHMDHIAHPRNNSFKKQASI